MEVRFVTRNVELPGDIKDYMEKKLFKIEKFFDRILDTQVALNYKRGMNVVEITSNVNGVVMRGEDYAPDLRKAFDKALKNIERQVKKHKSYLTDKARMKVQEISFDIDPELIPAPVMEKDEPAREIVKRKKFTVDVMTPVEATMQMDLLGHSFFLFKNDETGAINVVYRREEGGYGLLEPK
ncbi:MAG: ribosome-associated translation inhibitor RaiA [bacterium]|nr:ribosome-associated translation inhibitor RaiA [bacterium]